VTRKSKREIERKVEELSDTTVGEPIEIMLTDRVVETPWTPREGETDVEAGVEKTRLWRDEAGEWHHERVDADGIESPDS
jgi:hypothetical protein